MTVDHIVTVEGHGIARESSHAPYPLTFRCGYVGTQMLAFSWNDPVPALKPHHERSAKKRGKGRHTSHTSHTSKRAVKHSTQKKKSSSKAAKH